MPSVRALFALLVISAGSLAAEPRLNQIQVIGTHNSYHVAPHADLMSLLKNLLILLIMQRFVYL